MIHQNMVEMSANRCKKEEGISTTKEGPAAWEPREATEAAEASILSIPSAGVYEKLCVKLVVITISVIYG